MKTPVPKYALQSPHSPTYSFNVLYQYFQPEKHCTGDCWGSSALLQTLNELRQTAPPRAHYAHPPLKHCSSEQAFNLLIAKNSHYIAFDTAAIMAPYCFKLLTQFHNVVLTSSGWRYQCSWTLFRALAFHFQHTSNMLSRGNREEISNLSCSSDIPAVIPSTSNGPSLIKPFEN